MENTKTLYFQEPIKSWQRQLIPNLTSRDELEVVEEQKGKVLINHSKSGYEGWIMKDNLSDKPNDVRESENRKIDWD